jgi:hypothetical protein
LRFLGVWLRFEVLEGFSNQISRCLGTKILGFKVIQVFGFQGFDVSRNQFEKYFQIISENELFSPELKVY